MKTYYSKVHDSPFGKVTVYALSALNRHDIKTEDEGADAIISGKIKIGKREDGMVGRETFLQLCEMFKVNPIKQYVRTI
jgi:hypothetical protein